MKAASGALCRIGLLFLLLTGCAERSGYVVSTLTVSRAGWDTLRVDVQFARRALLAKDRPATPREFAVYLFNAAYDTLYAGAGRVVPVADRELGDREALMLEVCGAFEDETVCEQEAVAASPKRLLLQQDITFPEDPAFERGSYDLRFVVERQNYETGRWERIDHRGRVQGYLLAYVGEQSREAVKVPFSRSRGRFNLKGYPHYQDFQYHLKSTLIDRPDAAVRFDVYAGLGGQEAYRLASVEKRVHSKTEEERNLEVRFFTEQAAARILERLDGPGRDRRGNAYIDRWSFNRLTETYAVDLELEWQAGGRLFGRRHVLQGRLEVREDGAEARFLYRGANERAARLWREEGNGEALPLGVLEVIAPEAGTAESDDEAAAAPAERGGVTDGEE